MADAPPRPRRPLNGWAVAAAVGAAAAALGAYLPLVEVDGRSLSGSTVGVGNAVAWSVSDRNTITLLLERRDLAVILTLLTLLLAVMGAVGRWTRWVAGLGLVLTVAVFHLLLSMVQRAEAFGVPTSLDVSYSAGAVLCLAGPLLALTGFVAVLARRH